VWTTAGATHRPVRHPTHIRKRDGRIVPFDEGKIADAIYRAALAVGGEDRFLAEELASVVILFLVKSLGSGTPARGPGAAVLPGMEGAVEEEGGGPGGASRILPSIEQVQDTVEKVLIETGHARTAKAFILYRDRRARVREAATARASDAAPTLFDDRYLLVEDPAAERSAPFSAERLARTVAAEAGLGKEVALEVTSGVEDRLRRARVRRIPAPLLTSLVDAELLQRGFLGEKGLAGEPRRRSGALLARSVIDRALAPKGRPGAAVPPEEAARRLGGEALRAHALAEILPPEVASAHLDGTIHIHGLARPAALHTLTLSLDALKLDGVPGAQGRAPWRASDDRRRFLAQVGQAVRTLRGFVTHGVGVPAANLLIAPLLAEDATAADLREEAWHLLFEGSGGPDGVPVEFDLLLEVPPHLASVPARGPGGRRTGETLGDAADRARGLARALVAELSSGEGLPPRGWLPSLNFVVDGASLADPRSREILLEALAAALRGTSLRLILDRDGVPFVGTSRVRERVEDEARLGDPAALRTLCPQRVSLNLPRAAFRSPRGDLGAFFRECDRSVDLAVAAHRARRSLLATVAAGEGGALAPLFRRRRMGNREAPPPADLATGTWSVGVTGLNEAVAHLLGEELHEGDGAVKVGTRVLAYLALKVREAGEAEDLPVALDASESSRAAARFHDTDRREFHREQGDATRQGTSYTPGVAFRSGAPADVLLRLEREGRLHGHVRTATFRFDPATAPGVTGEGLLALVEKAFEHTPVNQIALGSAP